MDSWSGETRKRGDSFPPADPEHPRNEGNHSFERPRVGIVCLGTFGEKCRSTTSMEIESGSRFCAESHFAGFEYDLRPFPNG